MSDAVAVLVERARNDDAAFAELVARFEEAAFGWALRHLRDPEEARDACQDAFITAWMKLRYLREGAAFGGWLRRLVATQCNRRLRKSRIEISAEQEQQDAHYARREKQRLIANALSHLSESEHRIVVMFYFLGRTIDEIARILDIPRGTVGKRLYSARLAIRKSLPATVREEFMRLRPSPQFLRQVQEGLFDEYAGEYRFDKRPELEGRIAREDDHLVSYGGGQRSVLASIGEDALITAAYDGEGRFERDRAGRVVQFVYYEFGARLGVACKVVP